MRVHPAPTPFMCQVPTPSCALPVAPAALPHPKWQPAVVDQEVPAWHEELRDELLHVRGAVQHTLPGLLRGGADQGGLQMRQM